LIPLFHVHLLMLDHHDHHFMCISTMIVISYPCTIMLRAPSSHVLLCLTQFTWHNDISNLVSLITKTNLGLSMISTQLPTQCLFQTLVQPLLQCKWMTLCLVFLSRMWPF
jgi:hypothetical protein